MKKNFIYKSVILSSLLLANISNTNAGWENYVGAHVFNGIINSREDNQATERMGGFDVVVGTSANISKFVSWRVEGMYNMGYIHIPSTNYSSFTVRTGFEFGNQDSAIIPYFLIGGGIVAFDPPKIHIQVGKVYSGTFGLKVPFNNGWNLDMALEYNSSILDFSTVPGKTHLDRMGLALGVIKTF